jgi:hypothetical protein
MDQPTRRRATNQAGEPTDAYPWDRQPGEPPEWYARFERYRLLGTKRSVEQVYAGEPPTAKRGKAKRPNPRWYAVAGEWAWRERACAWDVFRVNEDAARQTERRRETVDAALGVLRAKLPDLEQQRFSARTWFEALRIVVDLQRGEYGATPPQKVELTGAYGGPIAHGHGFDLDKLTDEQVAQLAAMLDTLTDAD